MNIYQEKFKNIHQETIKNIHQEKNKKYTCVLGNNFKLILQFGRYFNNYILFETHKKTCIDKEMFYISHTTIYSLILLYFRLYII